MKSNGWTMARRCDNCAYYNGADNIGGECRFNAPTPQFVESVVVSGWPWVGCGDWCGDFDLRKDLTYCTRCGFVMSHSQVYRTIERDGLPHERLCVECGRGGAA